MVIDRFTVSFLLSVKEIQNKYILQNYNHTIYILKKHKLKCGQKPYKITD